MSQGLVNACNEVPWQYFVTLTFGTSFNQKRTPNKINRAFEWLRDISEHHRGSRRLDDWRWLPREESGELGGRFHYHFLLADLLPPTRSHCYAMASYWRDRMKVGFAVIRPYDSSLDGVNYVLKGLTAKNVRQIRASEPDRSKRIESCQVGTLSGHFNTKEANQYELGKYAKVNTLTESDAAMPSRALLEWLESRVDRSSKTKGRHLNQVRRRRVKHTSQNPV